MRFNGNKNWNLKEIKQTLQRINCISELDLKEILRPNGIADTLAKELKCSREGKTLKITQLRKIFNEIKNLTSQNAEDKNQKLIILWRLYPIITYSEARELIPPFFAKILNNILQKTENCQNFDKALTILNDFMTALYAYFKKYESLKKKEVEKLCSKGG